MKKKEMKDFEYFEPATLSEAIALLIKYKGKAKVIAGGTDLLVGMKQGVVNPSYLINIKNVPNLNHIDYDEKEGFRIGALTTLHSLETSQIVREKITILAQAAHQIGAPRIRNVGTIGGNLCQDAKCLYYATFYLWGRAPCYRGGGDVCYVAKKAKSCQAMATAETAPALICLDARVKVAGPKDERTLATEHFFVSAGVTELQEDEILTEIEIPNPLPHTAGVYLKNSKREAIDFAIVGVAVVLRLQSKDGACSDARIGLIGVARTPIRAHKAEEILRGEKIKADLIDQAAQAAAEEARPLGDIYASASHKKKMVRALVKKATREALEAANKA